MPEFSQEFLSWYLAPWRRIGRKEFGIALTLVTLPGFVMLIVGWGDAAGSFLAPLGQILDLIKGIQAGDYSGALAYAQKLAETGGTPVAAGWHMDWSGLVNALCLLGMVPVSRMRLRDMGWYGWQENALTAVFNISVVGGLVESVMGFDILPLGTLWGIVNFLGYGWLTFAKGKPKPAIHERVPETWTPPVTPTTPVEPKREYLNHDPDE